MNTRKTLLSAAIVSCIAFSAHAQQAAQTATDLDTVTVTGIRGSMEKSLDTKREANARVEVVTAEDVGKLPAHNVADTLQRLPGVNISSSSADEGGFDEADRVSLRGTSPSLTQTLINGHTVGSADWFVLSQGNNVGRSVSYSLLPSELVSSVEVNKSSQAKLQDGGTTGTVNIITRKPLEFSKQFTAEGSIGMVRSDQAKSNDPQYSALFNYKNDEGTFGVMVQGFSQKRELRREAQEIPGGFFTLGPNDDVVKGNAAKGVAPHPDLNGVAVPGLLGSTLFEQTRERKGGLVSLQFKPSDSLTLGLNGFSSELKANNYNRNFMMFGNSFAKSQAPDPGYVIKDGVLTNATYKGVPGTDYAVYDMIYRESKAKSSYVTFDADWQINDSLTAKFQAGSTKGTGETPRQYIAEVTLANGGGASWATHGNGSPIDWNVGGDISPNGVTSFGTWGNQQVTAEDKEKWATLDFNQYFNDGGVLSSIDFGLRFADHKREALSPEGATPGDIWSALKNGATANYPSGFAGDIGGTFPRNLWYFTPGALKDAVTNNSTWLAGNDGPTGRHNYGAEWKVKEKNFAGYVQANFRGDWWSGNVGLRYVNIKQDIDTYNAVSKAADADVSSLFGMWERLAFQNKRNRVLPSANIKFDLDDSLVLRVAASQTQTLPDYSALGASSYGSDLNRTGGGNPNLKPTLSTNLDANLEWYFMPRGLLSVGAYHMNLKDYIAFDVVSRQLYSELTNQLETYQISTPINADGKVTGVEVAYEQPIGEYFGINANYTYANGTTSHTWSDGSHNLLGTSKNTYNVGAYFENERFGARVSYTRRSSFLISLSGTNPYYQDDFGTLSASLSYKATDWLSISLDGLNLNNPTYKYYQTAAIPTSFYSNGRQYYLNFRFKY